MKRKLLATLLTSAMVVTSVMPAMAAATNTVTGAGTGSVYSPADIIDVVVPTDFKIAFNPLGVSIKNDNFTGNSQILSGTYAIQNRSTVPMGVSVAFKVTGQTTAMCASAAEVATDNVATTKPTAAKFSLNVVTNAKGASQALAGTVADKDVVANPDVNIRAEAAATGMKLSKLSTTPIALTNVSKAAATSTATVDFMLNAGPYTATYDAATDKVVYKAPTNATYDTVAFTFTGTTSTYADLWAKVTTSPNVAATYTLTQATPATYAATPFSPTSKDVVVKTGTCDVTVTKSTGVASKAHVFSTAPSLTLVTQDDGTKTVSDKNMVTLLNLKTGSKADSTIKLNDLGTYDIDSQTLTFTSTFLKDSEKFEAGFYQLTIGKQSFLMEVK